MKPTFKAGCSVPAYFDINPYRIDEKTQKLILKSKSKNSKDIPGPGGNLGVSKRNNQMPIFRPGNPGKKPGGSHAGTFNKFPEFVSENQMKNSKKKSQPTPQNQKLPNDGRSKKIFLPSYANKSSPWRSVVACNVSRVNRSVA